MAEHTIAMPSWALVQEIMRECQCNEERAISLLKRAKNDPEKAKKHHRTLMIHMKRPSNASIASAASRTRTPSVLGEDEIRGGSRGSPLSAPDSNGSLKPPSPSLPSNSDSRTRPSEPSSIPTIDIPEGLTPSGSSLLSPHSRNVSGSSLNSFVDSNVPTPDIADVPNNEYSSGSPPVYTPNTDFSSPPPSTDPSSPDLTFRRKPIGKIDARPQQLPIYQAYFPPPSEPTVPDISKTTTPGIPVFSEPMIELPGGGTYPPTSDSEPEPMVVDQPRFEQPEWNFLLPLISPPPSLTPGMGNSQEGFSLRDVIGAMQHGAPLQMIQNYLGYYGASTVQRHINDLVEGIPAMFYVVATNYEPLLREWVAYGGDVEAREASGVPLLAFAIMNSEAIQMDTSTVVATLLSLGASPDVIPSAFYSPFSQDLPDNGPEKLEDGGDDNKLWCRGTARARLARTANLTQRYFLERATRLKKPSTRHRQVAKLRNAEPLLGIPYFLVGQTTAANKLLQKLLSYIMVPSKRPLVLCFAGPSGHGKTELARRLGYLLSHELEVVDCTIYNREMELFGARAPYVGSENGSQLNNFLARNSGQRCIVFLDEFDKTSSEIHQTLLLPFDKGEYEDRRTRTPIDCSQTIWILATNGMDDKIMEFCKQNDAIFDNDKADKEKLVKKLSGEIKERSVAIFGAPITGRISEFIPFLPFTKGEQAVIVHKFLLELGHKVRTPISLRPGPKEQLLGNVRLRIRRDASVCKLLAEAGYHIDLGARSLITAVKTVEDMLVDVYLDENEEIAENDEKINDFVVDVNGGEVVGRIVPVAA